MVWVPVCGSLCSYTHRKTPDESRWVCVGVACSPDCHPPVAFWAVANPHRPFWVCNPHHHRPRSCLPGCLDAYSPACMPAGPFACSLLTCTHPRMQAPMHAGTHACACMQTHTPLLACTYPCPRARTRSPRYSMCACTFAHSHGHTHSRSLMHMRARARPYTHPHALARTRTHEHTRTSTRALAHTH